MALTHSCLLHRRIDWEDVQRTRVHVVKVYNDAPAAQKAPILKDALIIHLHSVTPPGDFESTAALCGTALTALVRSPQIESA